MSNKTVLLAIPASSNEWKEKDPKRPGTMIDCCTKPEQFEEYKEHIASIWKNYSLVVVNLPLTTEEINVFMKENAPNWLPLGNHFLASLSKSVDSL